MILLVRLQLKVEIMKFLCKKVMVEIILKDLYCVRSDLGNLLKALGRLEEAKVGSTSI